MVLQDAQATVEDIAGLALKTAAKRGRKAATLDVSALLGHESIRTTEAYLRWSPTRARRALDLVTLGGRR